MAEFKPFPLVDFRLGKYTAKQPWISPAQAWANLQDCYVHRGRLHKRRGLELFKTLYPKNTETLTPATTQAGTLAESPVHPAESAPSTYKVTFTDDGTGQTVIDDGAGNMIGDVDGGGTNTITYSTGAYDFDWASAPTGTVTATYEFERAETVMGIYEFVPRSGISFLLAADMHQVYLYDSTEERFNSLVDADTFTGGDSDFFWFTAFEDNCFISNGVDVVYAYKPFAGPPSFAEAATDFDSGSAGNDLDLAKVMVRHRGRLIYMNITENGTQLPGRARWTDVNLPESYGTSSGFADVPSNQAIKLARVVGDEIIVLLERDETWKLRYIGDASSPLRTPYEWVKLKGVYGGVSRFAAAMFEEELAAISRQNIVRVNGVRTKLFEPATPDIVLTWDPDQQAYMFGETFTQLRQMIFNYVALGESAPMNQLSINWENGSVAQYRMAIHVMAPWQTSSIMLWDDHTEDFDDWNMPFDEDSSQSGFPLMLAGNRSSQVLKMFTVEGDLGSDIIMSAKTIRWNPYKEQGRRAHLGYIQFVFNKVMGGSATVKLYRDFEDSPYLMTTFPLDGVSSAAKGVFTLDVNQIGVAHQLEIEHTGSTERVVFDAIIPYMKPQGFWRNVV